MDRLVTLFGGGGFLGRYVAQELLSAGARVRIAEREPKDAFFVKPLGGLGQTQFIACDITRADSAVRAARGSDAVVNLVGILGGNFEQVHVDGARNAAAAAREVGADAFVQASAIGADPQAESAYARTKGEGEAAARAAFSGATIIRPSVLFGPEERFLSRFARMAQLSPVIPVIRPKVRFQPVWVSDVARAIAAATLDPERHASRTYELGGPQTLSMEELVRLVCRETGRRRTLVPVPDEAARLMARLGGWLPGAPITWDQWLMLQRDNVASSGANGFEEFGINPAPLGAIAPTWLVQYRRHGRFDPSRRQA